MNTQSVTLRDRRPRNVEEALSELEREMQVRKRCYDRWVEDGKLSSVDAADRLDRLQTAIHLLQTHTEEGEVPVHGQ